MFRYSFLEFIAHSLIVWNYLYQHVIKLPEYRYNMESLKHLPYQHLIQHNSYGSKLITTLLLDHTNPSFLLNTTQEMLEMIIILGVSCVGKQT